MLESGLRLRGDLREGRGIGDREVGQHLAVETDLRLLQSRHELVVGESLLPRGRVDADDPEPPEHALARPAGGNRALAAVALGLLEDLAALLPPVDGTLDPSQASLLGREAWLGEISA